MHDNDLNGNPPIISGDGAVPLQHGDNIRFGRDPEVREMYWRIFHTAN